MAKNFEIRNSTAEFLTFIAEGKENGVQVLYKDETIWATQKAMATLFDVGVPAISKHLKKSLKSTFVETQLHYKFNRYTKRRLFPKWKQS